MLFSSVEFLFVFLPACSLAYLIVGRLHRPSAAFVLIIFSLIFYATWNYKYCIFLLVLASINWKLGNRIAETKSRGALALGIAINLANLGFFKYYYFIGDTVRAVMGVSAPYIDIILPLGISFFTFQKIAFLIDSYRGEVGKVKFLEFILFVFFFPQLIAGPIVRAKNIMPQLRSLKGDSSGFLLGLSIFSVGLVKKAIIADGIARYANPVFAAAGSGYHLHPSDAWSAAIAFAFQIYFDFSGYTDMAIGLGKMFGVELPRNFASPYQARSIIDFWRRWHITLSSFLRDYLYFPLGGSRRGAFTQYRNIMIVMLLGGLWHGAGWTFVIWGGLHGVYLVVNHLWRDCGAGCIAVRHIGKNLYGLLAWLLTSAAVTVAWVFFRAGSLSSAAHMASVMLGLSTVSPFAPILDGSQYVWLALLLSIVTMLPNSNELFRPGAAEPESGLLPSKLVAALAWRPCLQWTLASVLMFVTGVLFMASDSRFLYFQF